MHIQARNKIFTNINSSYLFSRFSRLISIEKLKYFNMGELVNMSYMFQNCISLEGLNLDSFDTRNVTNMQGMFSSCKNLINIIYGDNFVCKINEKIYDMYTNCSANRPTDSSWDGKIVG